MYFFNDLTKQLKDLCTSGLAISPWLAGVDGTGRFDPIIFEIIDSAALDFTAIHWTEEERIKAFGILPVHERLPRTALYETIASTAVLLANDRTGYLDVEENLSREVIQMVENFVTKYGLGTFVQIYCLVTSYENQNALAYYKSIPEKEFLLGHWHRPWIDYTLTDELVLGTLLQNYQIVIRKNRRYVEMSDQGYEAFRKTGEILNKSGYLEHRMHWLHISQFNLFDDYETMAHAIWPESISLRQRFLEWSGIKSGMKVLELGCADGEFTFDGGLAQLVGPTGRVISIDPSARMIARAETKRCNLDVDWVEFRKGKAECLPFDDGTFDAVIGVGFLHFTDLEVALREMKRVTHSNGIVASFHPLKARLDVEFFQQWFSPLLELSVQRKEPPKDFLLFPNQAPLAFESAGFHNVIKDEAPLITLFHDPDKVIQHFIYGVGWFQEELSMLPWRARKEIVELLRQRGHEIITNYPKDELVFTFPMQMVKGEVI
ncbi:methyltransferase domain-containing protein [Fodinisporobacter ferrooxydans]|uniref:Methyltransferase domain-containing protein n=1 Tax=Fodinisporobacter ferrooxydans TaxID=2901836 RepID=A0ABY4CGC1_9BACL|nr:methyltransferase domain-containing protein [Alicyclobacillaceae bacterium MYW30-H2]